MSIFRRENDEPTATPSQPVTRPKPRQGSSGGTTHIAAGTRIEGQVTGSTEVVVDGEVEGQLALGGGLIVGQGGEVRGEIEAQGVRVAGKVHGNIRATDRVELLQSGGIDGDVAAPRVVIADGAFFKGRVEMTGTVKRQPAAPPQKEKFAQPSAQPRGQRVGQPPGQAAGSQPAGPPGGGGSR